MPRLRGGCWPWLWCLRALIGQARRRVAGWIVRPFGEADQETFRGTVSPPNGFIALTPRAWRGFRTAGRGHAFGALRLRRWRNSQPSVEAGPDPERDGVVRWRRSDLARRIASAFGVAVHERTVGTYLAELGYRRLSVRPQHPKTDPLAQEAFKKTSARR